MIYSPLTRRSSQPLSSSSGRTQTGRRRGRARLQHRREPVAAYSMDYNCYASCAFGIEGVLAKELRDLGLEDVRASDARVFFKGDERAVATANMWARTADRIYIILGEFEAHTFEELYDKVLEIAFEDFLPQDASFPVSGNAVQSDLMSVSDIQSITKKAVVDAMHRKYGEERFAENGQRYHLYANNFRDQFTVALDTSGAGLSRRGYRLKNVTAPLRETLAAALVLIARWTRRDFYDPTCGSGTIAIEAAMIASDTAPGLNRRFDAQTYSEVFADAFADVRENALEQIHEPSMQIFGSDIDPKNVEIAREHAKKAGVGDWVTFSVKDVRQFTQPEQPACVISNPPYAVRLGERRAVEDLYREMGRVFPPLKDTVCFFLCESEHFERYYGRRADRRRKLYNGNMRCYYYQYFRRRRE